MRILLQRVSHAQVAIAGAVHSEIGQSFLLLLGIEEADGQDDIDFLCKKVAQIRLFNERHCGFILCFLILKNWNSDLKT